jgi:hypothetical protein
MKQDATYNKGVTTMQTKTTKPQTRPPVDREAIRVLAIELGAREAARRTGVNENTILSWSRRYKWDLPKRTGGPKAIELQLKPGNVLIASHKELESTTKTALMQTAAKAATKAAENPPLDVTNTSQFRDLANSSSRIFGWNTKAGAQTQFNQVVISQEQLREIGMLKESGGKEEVSEEMKKRIERLGTPEGQEELRRTASEWLGHEQNTEQPKLPATPSAPEIYEVTIRGDGGGVKIIGDEGATP